jgi:hypothetical protein
MSDLLGSQDIFCPQILAVSGEKRVFQHPRDLTPAIAPNRRLTDGGNLNSVIA